MMKSKYILVFGLFLFVNYPCIAQQALTTKSKKAEKAYQAAQLNLKHYEYDKALTELRKAKEADPNFVEAYVLQANLHLERREWQKAVDEFKKSFAINPNFFPASYHDCARAEMKLGSYADAKVHYETYLLKKRPTAPTDLTDRANKDIASCNFALEAMKNPLPFQLINAGTGINSSDCEYFPNMTVDERMFLFTRNKQERDPKTGVMRMSQEDFYISFKDDAGNWSTARNLGMPVNTERNEGAPSLSADGRFLFFAACEEYDDYGPNRQGVGSCDIFFTSKKNGQWSRPVNVGSTLNTRFWESQPSFSSDGKTLYFISSRPGGQGRGDIWMSELQIDNKWAPAVNLSAINTTGDEESVFIHPDNQTLYFSSDGHVGMGGKDLFMSRRQPDGSWGAPVNLGYPINTWNDESGLIVNGTGQYAYYTSDREGTNGCDDIYYFELQSQFRPVTVSYMRGKVIDAKTNQPVEATFELIDLQAGQVFIQSASDPVTGEFLVCLPINKDYALNVSSPNHLFYSESFQLKAATNSDKPVLKDIPLQTIEVGSRTELKNIFFSTGVFDLRAESKAELLKLVAFMNANPTLHIELSGHTDNIGVATANITLSQNRAKVICDFLIANGIAANRLTYKGYGDTKPKVPNDTDEHRQMNRRTEFVVTGK
jgi:outer membrane protein OmpA-like peptidoglycan-associated protein